MRAPVTTDESNLTIGEISIFDGVRPRFEYASSGQRFLNYLIDQVLIKFLLYWIYYFLNFGKLPLYNSIIRLENGEFNLDLFSVALSSALVAGIYFIIEGASGGLTIGKLITGTKAVKEDGYSRVNWNDAFVRSLCRLVPFEPLSGLMGYPWHDRWSKTAVIKTR